jgi:hypothetical protein
MIDECHMMAQSQLAHFMIAVSIKCCKVQGPAQPRALPLLYFWTRITTAIEGVGCFLVGSKGRKNQKLGSFIDRWKLQIKGTKHALQSFTIMVMCKEASLLVQ